MQPKLITLGLPGGRSLEVQKILPGARFTALYRWTFVGRVAAWLVWSWLFAAVAWAAEVPAVTSIADLRALSHEEAAWGYPVEVKAVVTFADEHWRTFFIQEDGGAGCYVYRTNQSPVLQPGQWIELKGRTVPGYMNAIAERSVTVSGTRPLPEANPATIEELISGVEDSQRVRVRTVIRSMAVEYGRLILDFGEGRGRCEAHIPGYTGTHLPTNLLDSIVEITGVAGANRSAQDHLIGIRLFVSSLEDIRVLTPSSRDPFDRPAQTIQSLFLVNPRIASGQRLCVTGAVTLASPSGNLCLRDATGSLGVKLDPPRTHTDPRGLYLDPPFLGALRPGDQVQVIGYPALGEYAPVLQDAWVRKLGSGEPPRPLRVTAEQALTGKFDGALVTLSGRLISAEGRPMGTTTDQILTIQSDYVIFEARLENSPALNIPLSSTVDLTGVCMVQADERRQPRAFRLLLRAADDVIVLERPPRWTLEHAARGLGIALAILAAAIGWLVSLRRRVRFQEERISGLRREAELQTRYRALFDSLQDVYYRADLNGITQEISPSVEPLLGFHPSERIGRPTLDVYANPEEREKLFQTLLAVGAVSDYEMQLRRKDGGIVTVSLNARVVRDASGQVIASEGFLRDISARTQTERALRDSQQLLASITHNISEGIYRSTPDRGLIYVNDAFVQMFGYSSKAEMLAVPSAKLYANREARAHLIELIQRHGRFLNEEVEFVRKDGSTFWGLASSIGIRDSDSGQIIFYDGAVTDITDRKRIEEDRLQLNAELERRIVERTAELRQSDERFTKAFNSNPAILTIIRLPEARYIDVNETFLRTFGFTREEVIGRTSLELNLWPDPQARAALFAEVESGKSIHNRETHYQTRNGEPRIVLQSLESFHSGGDQCLLSVGQDITESKRVQAALAESEAHTRLIIDNALDAVITIDGRGVIRGWNPQAEVIFGWKKEEIFGLQLADTLVPTHYRQAHRRGLQKFLETGEGAVLNRRIELTALRRDGQEFPAELAITALKVGESYIFSAFVRDITERRRAEEELLRALEREKELGKLKSNFVSMVSHEFRTPLGIIMSSEEILDRYFDRLTPEKRRDQLHAIHNAVKRMAEMMEEILLLGRVEAGKMECKPVQLDLNLFLRRLVDELHAAAAQHCPIEFDPAPLPVELTADEGLLRHIFTNLLSNAIKYSSREQPVHFSVREEGGQAVFTVEDHGVGIPEADQPWLFKAFHRGQNVGNLPGTGLGLTIVKRCVEMHGGKIKFHSTTGIGTTFIVTLPLFGKPVEVGAETAFFMNRP
jgi:PAS domain S-box-containing protein